MENMSLLDKFANPEIMPTLTFSEKMLATFYTTVLGMLITFSALVLIWGLTIMLSKIVKAIESKGKAEIIEVTPEPVVAEATVVEEEDDEELVAVISAAVAASLNTSIHNIVVTNIVRVNDSTPSWGVAGRSEQMNSRF